MKQERRFIRRMARRAQSLADTLAEYDIDSLPEVIQEEVNSAWGLVVEATAELKLADLVLYDMETPEGDE